MRKNIYLGMLLVVSACFAVSCQKDGDANSTKFAASIDQIASNAKTTLGSGDIVTWNSSDAISINGATYTTTADGTTSASFTGTGATQVDGYYHAYYPASIYNAGTPTLPATQTYTAGRISNLPMYAKSSNTSLTFHNICGVIELTLQSEGKSVSSIVVTSASTAINGVFSIANNAAVISGTPTTAQKTVTLQCGTAQSIETATRFWVAIPAGTHTLSIRVNASDGSYYQKTTPAAVTVSANHIYGFNWNITSWINACGPFLGNGRNLYFAKGNLKKESDTYSFFDNQWGKVSAYSGTAQDLFAWSTLFTSGESTSFTVGGQNWICPTGADWQSIIGNSRAGSTINGTPGCRYANVKVESVYGLLLCPDGANFDLPSGVTISTWNTPSDGAQANITSAQWATFEYAGCVFMPGAGYYINSEVVTSGEHGYWSSTADRTSSAFRLRFSGSTSGSTLDTIHSDRAAGFAIRLAQVF